MPQTSAENRALTQEEFTGQMGITTRQLQKIEKGLPKISFFFWLRFLGLMKPETQESFNQRFMPKAQEKIGTKPLRRADTSL